MGSWSVLLQRGGPLNVFSLVGHHCCNNDTRVINYWVLSSCLRIRLCFRLSSLYHHAMLKEVKAKLPSAVLIPSGLADERWLFDWDARYWGRGLSLRLLNRILIIFDVFITVYLLNGGKSIKISLFLIRYGEINFKICISCGFRWTDIPRLFHFVSV